MQCIWTVKIWAKSANPSEGYEFLNLNCFTITAAHEHPRSRRNWQNLWRHDNSPFILYKLRFFWIFRKCHENVVFRFSIAYQYQYCLYMYFVRNYDAPLFYILHKSIFRQFYKEWMASCPAWCHRPMSAWS